MEEETKDNVEIPDWDLLPPFNPIDREEMDS